MVIRKLSIAVFVALLFVGASAFAQTTGTLTGTVTTDGAPLPGATVTISSPAMQGQRNTVSGPNGEYSFAALPPGKYSVSFELEGMQKVTKSADVRLADTARADADLKVTKVAEAITVTATAPSVLETTTVSTSLTREQVEALPIGRTIAQRIQLAPGVNNAGPNNQTIINGAPSYDNLYLINGVVVNDSIRGQPENLFIEDAVQETTLLTGGVSAEYGRFTGGVVSTITKSGGNQFSGSLRDNFTNPAWSAQTPLGETRPHSSLLHQYEGTLGGYFLKDRLWFFGAGRKFDQKQANVTTSTSKVPNTPGISYVDDINNKRYEGKLTGQITSKHSLVGSYTHNNSVESANRFGNIVDLRSLTARQLPNWLEDFHYSGVITNSLLVEAQYSRRYFAFVGGGGPKDDLINGTLLRDNTTSERMWSPTFCACDPKTRNNKDLFVKGNYFLSTKSMGSHNIVAGYDEFSELRHENNYQSGSNYRIWGDFSAPLNGAPDGTIFFHTDPVHGFFTINPIAQLSRTSNVQTKSGFVNDKWDFSNHFSFNVGARYDADDARDQTHNSVATAKAFSPRLGIIYDIKGDGRNRISANYAKYVSHIDSGVADTVSVAGNPGSIYFNYRGPEINPLDKNGNVIGTPVPTPQVIQMVFDWFNAAGGVNGYKDINSISVPGLTARLAPGGLRSPSMNEVSAGYGHQIGSSGYVRADVIHRSWRDFYNEVLNTSTGQNIAPNGSKVDVALVGNITGPFSRNYNGVQLQAAYRLFRRINVGGNYTYSKIRGNVESETFNNATVFAGSPGSTTTFYPEYFAFARNNPTGYLNEDMRHRGTIYGSLDIPIAWGGFNVGAIERFHTGSPYSAVAAIDARPFVTNPGYATPPSSSNYYFSDRGAFRLPTVFATDLSVTYTLPTLGKVNVFLRGDLINVLNERNPEYVATNIGNVIETRVYTKRQRAKSTDGVVTFAAFNPFTTTPVQYIPGKSDPNGTYNYQLDPNFGRPTNSDAYGNATSLNPNQVPRTYRFAVGLRF
jgi:hypothetical protein